jgi:hypothetical protein
MYCGTMMFITESSTNVKQILWYKKQGFYPRHEGIILNFGRRWRSVAKVTPRPTLPLEKNPGILWIGGCMGSRDSMDGMEKWKNPWASRRPGCKILNILTALFWFAELCDIYYKFTASYGTNVTVTSAFTTHECKYVINMAVVVRRCVFGGGRGRILLLNCQKVNYVQLQTTHNGSIKIFLQSNFLQHYSCSKLYLFLLPR